MTKCKKCRQEITWGQNHKGTWIPLNSDGTNHLENCGTSIVKFRKGYKSRGKPRGSWKVSVFKHPTEEGKYCFGYSIGAGVRVFEEIPGEPSLSGSFDSPEEALEAGVMEIYNDE